MQQRIGALRATFDALNDDFYSALRDEIRRGKAGPRLRRLLCEGRAEGDRYSALDDLVGGVLRLVDPGSVAKLPPEMVFYQPTPARHIGELIERADIAERDVCIDLGSGLGHVPLLVSICTGAHGIGIEREAAYVDCARRCASALNVANVAFVRQDARDAQLSSGTVFYLYTPFTGSVLRSVLDALKREAATRAIRVCTYGPCTSTIAAERWLRADDPPSGDRVAVFRSV